MPWCFPSFLFGGRVKKQTPSRIVQTLGQDHFLRCHPAWRKTRPPLRIPIYADLFHGGSYSVAHTKTFPSVPFALGCPFPILSSPRSHRPRLSLEAVEKVLLFRIGLVQYSTLLSPCQAVERKKESIPGSAKRKKSPAQDGARFTAFWQRISNG